uniref:Probable serine/threonine-protein kinase cdc7 n=1 Tax=Dermatophagoides pteronyssinus TaxID=6956 RepID=A0A6P6XQ30_DERPT|nr:probable serine/threonine-protein kinase cdc7 [Dermatophagoides pteronyssinus]
MNNKQQSSINIDNDMVNVPIRNDINNRKQLLKQQQQREEEEIVKNMKIKRSISNFDTNYLNKLKLKNTKIQNFLDNPWYLKRPIQNPSSTTNLLEQYLSFEFLNERIHNRLQQELECSPNNTLRYFNFETSKSDSATTGVHNDNNQNQKSLKIKSHHQDQLKIGKNLSYSEMNLTTISTKKLNQQPKQSKTVNKRKSFRKFLEHYFNNNNGHNETNEQQQQQFSNGYDQNFILKRSTPNAGLTDDERYKILNCKHYSEQQESNIFNRHSLRQWKKTNQMVANLFNINNNQDNQNRFEDTDYLSVID